MKTRIHHLIALLSAGLLVATAATAAEDATWGQVKNADTVGFAAKRPTTDSGTATTTESVRASAMDSTNADGRTLYAGTLSGAFGPTVEGSLQVRFPNYGSWNDAPLAEALFEVAPGSMATTEDITMQAIGGYAINEAEVRFGPAGLEFMPPARLTLIFWWNGPENITEALLAELSVQAQHIYADGTVVEVSTQSSRKSNSQIRVVIDVPGFSRYGMW